jgi:hypothetical protein
MFRIDSAGAVIVRPTPAAVSTPGFFGEGTPGVSDATVVTADWLNMLQEELAYIVTTAGLSLNKADVHQVVPAIRALIAAACPASIADNGWQVLPSGLIIQWGYAGIADDGSTFVSFPVTFPNACLNVSATARHDGSAVTGANAIGAFCSGFTASGAYLGRSMYFGDVTVGVNYVAIGY